ncbi:hypothetical protein B9479_007575 [Cryptococcus floricola]|uniref:Uncharacterized protein n=1 Tax=Cryptococcus floricola TaxID=2591691 RepID=A0A5D3AJY5_9TREE|nr:hypothetical protein B9479_007575 [Cryptococcus floricola]
MSYQHTDQYAYESLATTADGDEEEGRPTDFSSAVDPSRSNENRQRYRPGDTINMSGREKQINHRIKKNSIQTRINTLNGSDPGTGFNKLRGTSIKELEERLSSLEEQQPQAPVEVSSRQAVTEAGSGMAMEVSEEGVGSDRKRQEPRRNKEIPIQMRINTLNGLKELEERLRSLEEQQPQAPVGGSSRHAATEAGSDMAIEESLRQLQVDHSQEGTQAEGHGDTNTQDMELDDDGAADQDCQRAAMSPSVGSEPGNYTSFEEELDFMLQHGSTGGAAYDPYEQQGQDPDQVYYLP